jgi:hypothetical protein
VTITKELLLKIARLAGDERGDPATRAVAMAKLEVYHLSHPELFVLDPAPSTEAPDDVEWGDVEPDKPNADREEFLRPSAWRSSAKGNPWRLYRKLSITIFPDQYGDGLFKWCCSDSHPVFSRDRFATVRDAQIDCWLEHVAPRFGLDP